MMCSSCMSHSGLMIKVLKYGFKSLSRSLCLFLGQGFLVSQLLCPSRHTNGSNELLKHYDKRGVTTLASLSTCEGVSNNNTPCRIVKQKPELNTGADKSKAYSIVWSCKASCQVDKRNFGHVLVLPIAQMRKEISPRPRALMELSWRKVISIVERPGTLNSVFRVNFNSREGTLLFREL